MNSEQRRLNALRVAQRARRDENDRRVLAASRGGGTRAEQAASLGMSENRYYKVLARALREEADKIGRHPR